MASVYVYDDSQKSEAEKLMLDALAGYLARETPRLYRVHGNDWHSPAQAKTDSYTRWLQDMAGSGLQVNEDLFTANAATIIQTAMQAAGLNPSSTLYIRCDMGDKFSVSAAVTQVASNDTINLIAPDDSTAKLLESIGVKMLADTQGKKVKDVIDIPEVLNKLSKREYMFVDPTKHPGSDFAVFARAAILEWGSEPDVTDRLMKMRNFSVNADGMGAAFGWGPENDYLSYLNPYGVMVHASDWVTNLAALQNW